MGQFIKTVDHGSSSIDLSHLRDALPEARPFELHHKNDGAIGDKPSFTIVMKLPHGGSVFGQFSLDTLNQCLSELNYSVVKKK